MKRKTLSAILSALLIMSTTASTVFASASVESADIDMTKQTSYSQQAEVHAEVETSLTVTVPKKIVLDALVNRMEFKVNAKGDLPGDKKVVVAPTVTKFNLESVGKQSVEATVNFPNTEWTHEDVAAKLLATDLLVGTDHAGDIQYGTLTAGKWKATFDFNISIVDVDKETETEQPQVDPEPVDAGFVNIVGGGNVTAIDNDYVLNNYKNNMGLLNYEEWQGSYKDVTEDNLVAAFRFGGGLTDGNEDGAKLYKAHFVTDEKLSENAKIIQAEWGFAGYALFELQPYESGNCGLGYVITENGFDIISTSSDSVSTRDFIIVDEKKN